MNSSNLEFKAINLLVNNIHEAVCYYESLGFSKIEFSTTKGFIEAKIIVNNSIELRLRQLIIPASDIPSVYTHGVQLEFCSNKELSHEEAFLMIEENDIEYSGITLEQRGVRICGVGETTDPDGNHIAIVDHDPVFEEYYCHSQLDIFN